MLRLLILVAMLALSAACAGTEEPGGSPGTPCESDFDCESNEVCEDRVCRPGDEPEDAGNNGTDTGGDTDRPDTPGQDTNNDSEPDVPELGLLGEPCDIGDDCRSGYCITNPDDGTKLCTDFCSDDSCPLNYSCAPLRDGADRVFLCFPAVDILCEPCEMDTDCGGASDLCVSYGFASFCGQNCEVESCPEGYECVDVPVEGGTEAQCFNAAGTCIFCEENTYDLDGDPANGCEYECVYEGPDDLPDSDFIDSNCDGIDGNIFQSVFVAQDGSDVTGSGSPDNPFRSITAAMTAAEASAQLKHIIVSEGTYTEPIVLRDGLSIWGSYSRENGWQRSASFASVIEHSENIDGQVIGVKGEFITDAAFGFMHVRTGVPVDRGISNYGIYCSMCPGLRIVGNTVMPGPGSEGIAGTVGSAGGDGAIGGDGRQGSCDGGGDRRGGTAGFSPCGHTGGMGGMGGREGHHAGAPGAPGNFGTSGGSAGSVDSCDGNNGGNGDNGTSGTRGNPGAGGATGGAVINGFWAGFSGEPGLAGGNGNGGGGGGGGGGQGEDCFICVCNDGGGNGGGGGGGGGCGGGGGTGGGPGGGSFGIFVVDSEGISVIDNTVITDNGGRGGMGGDGGTGGRGMRGGFGATNCTDEVGAGGNGGTGGDGGPGGYGGGGAGGDSIAVYFVRTSPSLLNNDLTVGNPGPGGASNGTPGADGRTSQFVTE